MFKTRTASLRSLSATELTKIATAVTSTSLSTDEVGELRRHDKPVGTCVARNAGLIDARKTGTTRSCA